MKQKSLKKILLVTSGIFLIAVLLILAGFNYKNALAEKNRQEQTEELFAAFDSLNSENETQQADSLLREALALNSTHPKILASATSYFVKQQRFDEAKNMLDSSLFEISEAGFSDELMNFGLRFIDAPPKIDHYSWRHLAERVKIEEDLHSLVEIGKGQATEKSSRDIDENSTVWDKIIADQLQWTNTSSQDGYITNHSKTLVVDVKVTVKFTVTRETSVTLLLTFTQTETENVRREIVLKDIQPGETRPFSASIRTSNEYYGEGWGSEASITRVRVDAVLLSPQY